MRNSSRLILGAILGSLIASVSAAVAVAQAPTIRIAHFFIGSSTLKPIYEEVLKEWQTAHPDVNLVIEASPDLRIKLQTDLAANNTPDVYYNWAGPANMGAYIDGGVALDIREFVAKSKVLTPDFWSPAQLAAVSFNGAPYMLPTTGFKCFTIYNTAIFKQYNLTPPETWDQLLAVSKTFGDAGITPIGIGSKGGNPGHLFYNAVLGELEGGPEAILAADATSDVSSAPFSAAADIIKQMKDAGVFPADTVANGDWGPSVNLYNQSKAAMLYTCPWMISHLEKSVADVSEGAYFPQVPGFVHDPKSFNVGGVNNGWMINKQSWDDPAKQAAIASLVDAMFDPRILKATIEGVDMPAFVVNDMSPYQLDPLLAKVYTFTAKSPDVTDVLASHMPTSGALTAFLDASDRMFAGDDPKTIIDEFQAAVTRAAD